jgi:plasmid stabilization system protein ParE
MTKPVSKAKTGNEVYRILWDTQALIAVEKIYKQILEKSFQGAENVKNEIFERAESLSAFPERFPVDRDLKSPYRRCLVRNFRIIYRIYEERKDILIIYVWNSKRDVSTLIKPGFCS